MSPIGPPAAVVVAVVVESSISAPILFLGTSSPGLARTPGARLRRRSVLQRPWTLDPSPRSYRISSAQLFDWEVEEKKNAIDRWAPSPIPFAPALSLFLSFSLYLFSLMAEGRDQRDLHSPGSHHRVQKRAFPARLRAHDRDDAVSAIGRPREPGSLGRAGRGALVKVGVCVDDLEGVGRGHVVVARSLARGRCFEGRPLAWRGN